MINKKYYLFIIHCCKKKMKILKFFNESFECYGDRCDVSCLIFGPKDDKIMGFNNYVIKNKFVDRSDFMLSPFLSNGAYSTDYYHVIIRYRHGKVCKQFHKDKEYSRCILPMKDECDIRIYQTKKEMMVTLKSMENEFYKKWKKQEIGPLKFEGGTGFWSYHYGTHDEESDED